MAHLRALLALLLVMLVAGVFGACTDGDPGKLLGAGDAICGDKPTLPYACGGGVDPCTCTKTRDGVGKWECGACPAVDCNTNPGDAFCVQSKSCIGCHGLASADGKPGVENAHAWSPLSCTDCHGGKGEDAANPSRQLTRDEAHVAMPKEMADQGSTSLPSRSLYASAYLGRAGVEKMQGGLEWIRFMNPTDLRIVDNTCSKAGCHGGMGETVRRSTMSTLTGKYDAMLEIAGLPRDPGLAAKLGDSAYAKHLATYGAINVTDPDWDPAKSPPGSVPGLVALVTKDRETQKPFGTFTEHDMMSETMNKLCGDCHLNNNGSNNKYGNFRSAGCAACHMPYDFSGQSKSGDPNIRKEEPRYPAAYKQITYPEKPHPVRHQLQRTMTANDCLQCHTGSNRTVLQYMGIRTDDNRDLTRAKAAGVNVPFRYAKLIDNQHDPEARIHGFTQDQLIEYEDLDGDGQDDTPPDVHYTAGLECIDCHVSAEMHGDGKIYSRQSQETKVRCVHCHGNLEFEADPDADNNPINSLYRKTNKPARKYLRKFDRAPLYGEEGYPFVKVAGTWLKTKTKGDWKWVPQIKWGVAWDPNSRDCVGDGRRVDPRTNSFVCSPNASLAHGRWNGTDPSQIGDGLGPRPGVEVIRGADGQSSNVRMGFSHLGERAKGPNVNHEQGLECASCHATWHNMRYGNHLGLRDMVEGQRVYDWDRVTGQITIGKQGWFDFTFVDMLDLQLGVDAKGKISQFIPTRLKMFVRQAVLDPGRNALVEFNQDTAGDPRHAWKTFRDRVGLGNLMNGAGGLTNAPGSRAVCQEPQGFCDTDQRKNVNGALGVDQMEPHAIQKRPRDCTSCHVDAGGGNLDKVRAVYGMNPNGYTPQTSAYLAKMCASGVETPHGKYDACKGFVIADDGVQHRLDHFVDEATGYPLASTLHVKIDGGRGYQTYESSSAGPIPKSMIDKVKTIRVKDIGSR